ncbi:MAG: hypothetical protein ABIR32_10740 [Ilumatobacteraceae bacterium]
MAPSSSANKVAKLAQKGKGKKVRFQGGVVFPAVIVGVLVLLIPLIVYARQSRPGPGEGEPTINQHWHAAYSTYVCDENGLLTLPIIAGTLEEQDTQGNLISQKFQRSGIHSHGDGVIHWHPYTGAATGTNARLKVFLNNYDIKLSDKKLELPASQGAQVYEEGTSKCAIDGQDKDASLKLWVWSNYSDIGKTDPAVYTANMGDVRVDRDGMVFVVAFVPDDVAPVAPDYASRLPELGAADGSGPVTPDTTSTGDSVAPDGSVVVPETGDSTPGAGSTATSTVTTGSTDTTTGSTTPSTVSASSTATSGG